MDTSLSRTAPNENVSEILFNALFLLDIELNLVEVLLLDPNTAAV